MRNLVHFPMQIDHCIHDGTAVHLVAVPKKIDYLIDRVKIDTDDTPVASVDMQGITPMPEEVADRHWYKDNEGYHNYSKEHRFIIAIGKCKYNWWFDDWYCKYEDLTRAGKDLYMKLVEIYNDCDVYILTTFST